MFTETLITRQPFIQTLIRGYRCDPFSNAHRMGPSSALYKAILQHRLFWIWWGPWGHSRSLDGRSQGQVRRAAGRRWPQARRDADQYARVEGHTKTSKSGQSTPDANVEKLTAFFSRTSAAPAAAAAEKVRAMPSVPGPQPSCLWHFCLWALASAHSSSPLPLCSAPVTARSCDHSPGDGAQRRAAWHLGGDNQDEASVGGGGAAACVLLWQQQQLLLQEARGRGACAGRGLLGGRPWWAVGGCGAQQRRA